MWQIDPEDSKEYVVHGWLLKNYEQCEKDLEEYKKAFADLYKKNITMSQRIHELEY